MSSPSGASPPRRNPSSSYPRNSSSNLPLFVIIVITVVTLLRLAMNYELHGYHSNHSHCKANTVNHSCRSAEILCDSHETMFGACKILKNSLHNILVMILRLMHVLIDFV